MSPEQRGWQPFQPGDDPLPATLSDRGEEGEVVVLAAADGARLASWSREAAASVARSWAVGTERLLLMDLDLESPGLHRLLGVENEEGATDVFLFGSSIRRVARAVDDGAFYFAPAGTATSDPDSVLRHRRWERLVRGFREARARLLLYLPLDAPGSDAVLERADRVVVLGGRGALDDERLAGPRVRVAVALGPRSAEEPGTMGSREPGAAGGNPASDDPGPVMDIGDLAPDEEVVDIADLAPDDDVVEIAELAPDEPVVDIGELAPDRPAAGERRGGEPVPAEAAASAPAAPAGGEAVDIADLAPDEPQESVAGTAEGEVVDIADLAPDAPAGAGEASAPSEPVGAAGVGAGPPRDEEAGPGGETDRAPSADEAVGEAAEEVASEGRAAPDTEPPAPPEEQPTEAGPAEPAEASGAGPDGSAEPADADAGDFGDFDMSSLDELSEGVEPRMDDVEEPAGAAGTGDETTSEDRSDAPGDFDEEGASGEAVGAGGEAPGRTGPDDVPAGGETPSAGGGDETVAADFGEDLVTGPDFGDAGGGEAETAGPAEDAGPAGDAGPSPGPAGTPATAEPEGAEPRPPEDGASAGREATVDVEAPARGEDDAPAEVARARPRRKEEERTGWGARSRRPIRLTVLLLLVVAGAASAHWYGVVRVPGLDDALAAAFGPANTGRPPVVESTEPPPSTPVMEYSLLVDSYRNIEAAGEVATALSERLASHVFVVAPVQTNGEVSHRILAGPAETEEAASGLREPLGGVLDREDPEDWTVRATPLAFLVEESGALRSARARATDLSEQGVPAYVLQVDYPDGSTGYRVYAGAYETTQEARAMKGILAQAGVTDATFTERRGRIPE